MPEISRFLGIVIAIFHRDHGPPHFHAYYDDHSILVEIETGKVTGKFPRRALTHVLEWWLLHRDALSANGELASKNQALRKIEPLE